MAEDVHELLKQLTQPHRLWTRAEVIGRPAPVPAVAGAYAWYFKVVPGEIDASECVRANDLSLLYVGIAPRRPSSDGTPSRRTLRDRLRSHYRGNAAASTLRTTLGCLLGLPMVRTRSGQWTFGEQEKALNEWMDANAFVAWVETPEPWNLEDLAIRQLDLPLNLRENSTHAFATRLAEIRRLARQSAGLVP